MFEWQGYDDYCAADTLFYDSPERMDDAASRFSQSAVPAPEGWQRREEHLWIGFTPPGLALPEQGWKVHLSARVDEAASVIERAFAYCVANSMAFKFLRSRAAVVHMNSKHAWRARSGKLVTLYPDETQLARVIEDLSSVLAGVDGPYILSDLRIGTSPLYVRYGAFRALTGSDEHDEPVYMMRAGR